MSVIGKVYDGILVKRVRQVTKEQIIEEQSVFISGRGCVDQIIALKQMSEKMKEKSRKLYFGFMDL